MAVATRRKVINAQMKSQSKSNQYGDSCCTKHKIIKVIPRNIKGYSSKQIELVNASLNASIAHRLFLLHREIWADLSNSLRRKFFDELY